MKVSVEGEEEFPWGGIYPQNPTLYDVQVDATLPKDAKFASCGVGIVRTLLFQDRAVPLPYGIQVVELIQVSSSTSDPLPSALAKGTAP